MTHEIRPYQLEAVKGVSASWLEHREALLVMATGTGKTFTFVDIIRRRKAAGRGRALIIAHRKELLTQAKKHCEEAGLTAELEMGDHRASVFDGLFGLTDVVIGTVQTLKAGRLRRWPPGMFGTIIIDEAHHSAAKSYRNIIDHFADAKMLGVTATPDRGDGIALGHVFSHVSFEYSLRRAILEKNLCPIKVVNIDAPYLDTSSLRVTKQEHGRDFRPEDLAAQMKDEAHLHLMADPIVKEAGDRQTIVFVPSVETAHELARVMSAYTKRRVVSLDGESAESVREKALADYESGEVQFLVNCALFTEGFDAPATSCIVMARNTKSRALYAQCIGRGTRNSPGKENLLVIDVANNANRHSLISPVDLFDGKPLPPDVREEAQRRAGNGEDVLDVVIESEAVAKQIEEKREKQRRAAAIAAEVRYARKESDPMVAAQRELGLKKLGNPMGPKATEKQVAALARLGITVPGSIPSQSQASAMLRAAAERRKAGLCTLAQSRLLREHRLNTNMKFDEASLAFDALKANGWQASAEILQRWGAPA